MNWRPNVKNLFTKMQTGRRESVQYHAGILQSLQCQVCSSVLLLLLLLLPSRFSRVRLCATPKTATHQAPPSLGFSRQEHWSGLPFPSPVQALLTVFVHLPSLLKLSETKAATKSPQQNSMRTSKQNYLTKLFSKLKPEFLF